MPHLRSTPSMAIAIGAATCLGPAVVGCAPVEHKQQLVEASGRVATVPVGGALATIRKQKDLPNAFGNADIMGRKVDTGYVKLVYKGPGTDGGAMLQQIDVDVHSNASVYTRMPAVYSASSTGSVVGDVVASGGMATGTITGSSSASAMAMAPHAETNIVMPPNVTTFTVPKGKSLTLPTGQTIEFLDVQSHQVSYRIVGDAR